MGGNQSSSLATPAPPVAPSAPSSSSSSSSQGSSSSSVAVTPATFPLSAEDVQLYLQYRVPSSIVLGGLWGGAWGFYVGDAAALYACTYAFGLGFASTAFFCGTYGLRSLRQQDDMYNYAASGAVNGAWMATGLAGRRRGAMAAVAGAVGGAALKVTGDWFYDTARQAWLIHRRVMMDDSRPRLLGMAQNKLKPPTTGPAGLAGAVAAGAGASEAAGRNSKLHPIAAREEIYIFGRPSKPKVVTADGPSSNA